MSTYPIETEFPHGLRVQLSADVEIWRGDCLAILPHLQCVDAVITDAPYRHAHMDGGGFASATKFYRDGAIDFISDFDFAAHIPVLFCAPVLVSFCSRDLIRDYANAASENGYTFDLHAWHKTNAIPFCCNTFKSDLEYIIVAWKGKKGIAKRPQHELGKLYQSSLCTGTNHPTEKPVDLMQKYVRAFGAAATILDPFMGSGTTLVAAHRLGRRAIGIELDPVHFATARRRLTAELAQPRLDFTPPPAPQPQELFAP